MTLMQIREISCLARNVMNLNILQEHCEVVQSALGRKLIIRFLDMNSLLFHVIL